MDRKFVEKFDYVFIGKSLDARRIFDTISMADMDYDEFGELYDEWVSGRNFLVYDRVNEKLWYYVPAF